MMRKNKLISVCLILSLMALPACGSTETAGETIIELKEPTGAAFAWITETAIRRNIYMVDTYTASVYPEVEEYAYETRQTFEAYEAMLGDVVEAGDALIKGNTESLEKQIENLEERLAKLAEDYQEYLVDINEEISSKEWYVDYYEEIFGNLEEQEPEEYITGADGNAIRNPEYSKWEREWNSWLGKSNKNELDLWVAREGLRQKTEVYDLDYAFYSEQLREVKAQKVAATIKSGIDGEVVGIGMYYPDQSMAAENIVVAVGDTGKLCLKCEYINRRNILYSAEEVYAFINGTRYELIYDDNGDKECSTFYFADENVNAEVGDFAVIVLEMNSREQVIAVKSDAVYVDTGGYYVYAIENDATVKKPVKTGVSDGVYTEIVSGLEEGEEILVSEKVDAVNTQVLELGTYARTFSKSGELYYPIQFYLANPIEYGTVYFQEYLVDNYQYVEAGQPVVRVRVEGDMVEVARMENEVMRAKERLADLMAQVTEENAESYADRIEQQQESIAEQEEQLNNLKSDYATVEICAEKSGVIMNLSNYSEEESIGKNAVLLRMADATYGYLMLADVDNVNYGDVLTLTYNNANRQSVTSEAVVVTLGTPGVSATLDNGATFVRIPEEMLNDLLDVLRSQGASNFNRNRIRAAGAITSVDNVLLVPKDAVTVVDESTYVNVLQEDGSVVPISFLAGGNDGENYWVIEGLTEGMTICWE